MDLCSFLFAISLNVTSKHMHFMIFEWFCDQSYTPTKLVVALRPMCLEVGAFSSVSLQAPYALNN